LLEDMMSHVEALVEARSGRLQEARRRSAVAVEVAQRSGQRERAALFTARARTLAGDLEKNHPEDTLVLSLYLPALRALFALDARDPAAAIQSLQSASRFDLAFGGIGFYGYFGKLYPLYVRGEAYRAARQPNEAIAEFQRILDHRSIVLVDPVDALTRLQLARTLVLSGDIAKAKNAYNDLFALWPDADQDVPVIKEARAEYARLP
jgi:tetratricopeptide (TPR) repeat protein